MFFLVRRIFRPIGVIRRELVEMAGATRNRSSTDGCSPRLMANLDELRQTLYAFGEPRRDGDTLLFGDNPSTTTSLWSTASAPATARW